MKLSPTYKMPFKRRRENKTDYKKRLKLLLAGKPRLVVRRSLKYMRAQIIEFDPKGDKTLVSASSQELKKLGWTFACDNVPAAYLTGLLIAKKAKEKNIKDVVLDMGLYRSTKGNRMYALAKGAVDGGLNVPVAEGMFPSKDRIVGKHIHEEMEKKFEEVKRAITG